MTKCATCKQNLIGVFHCNDCYQSHSIPKENEKILAHVILDIIRTDKSIRQYMKDKITEWEAKGV